MAYKVFVSHSMRSPDIQVINGILQQAALIGIQCYLAEHDVQGGVQLEQKLRQQIQAADCVLVLITRNSVQSDWVKWEVGIANGFGKLVIPVVERGVASPPFLAGKEYIELDPHNPTRTIQAVSQQLARLKVADDRATAVGWLVLGVLGLLLLSGTSKQ